ncbi:hypothetical protein [Nocardioides jishulii]|nr:hypothetical protein [Nocardioides jishulii]
MSLRVLPGGAATYVLATPQDVEEFEQELVDPSTRWRWFGNRLEFQQA